MQKFGQKKLFLSRSKEGGRKTDIVCMIFIIGIGIGTYFLRKNSYTDWSYLDKKIHPFRYYYDISYWIYQRFEILFQKRDAQLKKQLRCLSVVDKKGIKETLIGFRCRQITMFLLVLFSGCIITFLILFYQSSEKQLRTIIRNPTGSGIKQVELILQKKDSKRKYQLDVEEVLYTKTEWEDKKNEAISYIENVIKGENKSLDEVNKDLYFPEKIEGNEIDISYESNFIKYISDNGVVDVSEVPKEGQLVNITVYLQYKEFHEEFVYTVRVVPKNKTKEEREYEQVIQVLQEQEAKSLHKNSFILPSKIGNYNISLEDQRKKVQNYILFFSIGVGILLFIREEETLKDQLKDRKEQLTKEYPEFVHQLVLFIGAGMTLKAALNKMASNYRKKKKETNQISYLYEELLALTYELQAGVSEEEVYRAFGNRLELPLYKRMMELLIQGVKKGSTNIISMLEQEEKSALEVRKEQAKRLGEEAGTKLLMPMVILLGVVLVLVLYPAMAQFQMF